MNAIATKYDQLQFRSRLEATWAAFFDYCGWPWAYEPIDLNGWIPDFAIGHRPMLEEIKPFFTGSQWAEELQKIRRAAPDAEVILFGAAPTLWRVESDADQQIAWIYDTRDDTREPLHFGTTEGNGKPGMCTMDAGWMNCIWKPPEGIRHPNKWARVMPSRPNLREIWHKAQSLTQWKAPA